MDWWLIVRTPDGIHGYHLGDRDDSQLDDLIDRAAVVHDVPPDWIDQEGWEVQKTGGEPHETLLAQTTVHPLSSLSSVTPSQLDARRRAVADISRAERVANVERALASLDTSERDEFLDRHRTRSNPG